MTEEWETKMGRVLPILFNTDMVLAILDDRKTNTRRILKFPKHIQKQENGLYTLFTEGTCYENQHLEEIVNYIKPPYQPGNILYVRETWVQIKDVPQWEKFHRPNGHPISPEEYIYKADNVKVDGILPEIKWHPSIHMPKDAARIWLRVTDVRVERLQDIDDEGAKAEGANWHNGKHVGFEEKMNRSAIDRFKEIWNSTIKPGNRNKYGWGANPWVWVIEFERCEKP